MSNKGVNKVILVGHLGQDPQLTNLPSGGYVANITLATSESWADKQSGQKREKTEWHTVAIFGKLAEVAGQYLRKGSQVYIEGSLQTRKWQDQSGNDRYTTEVVVQGFNGTMQMLGGRQGSGQSQGGFQQQAPAQPAQQQGGFNHQKSGFNQASAQSASQQGGFQQQAPARQQQGGYSNQPQQAKAPDLDEGWDDDIPFAPLFLQYPKLMYCI